MLLMLTLSAKLNTVTGRQPLFFSISIPATALPCFFTGLLSSFYFGYVNCLLPKCEIDILYEITK